MTAQPAVRGRTSGPATLPGEGAAARGITALLAAVALLFLGLPVAALIWRSLASGALRSALGAELAGALWLSLVTTAVSTLIVVGFGSPLAWVLARRTFRGRVLAEALVDLPIILPPSVAGLALLLAFGRRGSMGPALEAAGLVIPFTTLAVVVAQVFVAAPFYIRAARAGFSDVHRELEEAAAVDGATALGIVRHVTLPMASPALAAGLVLAWARALGEFGATIMFAGSIAGRTQTLPLLVYAEFQGDLDTAVAAAAVLVLAAMGVLVAVRLRRWPPAERLVG